MVPPPLRNNWAYCAATYGLSYGVELDGPCALVLGSGLWLELRQPPQAAAHEPLDGAYLTGINPMAMEHLASQLDFVLVPYRQADPAQMRIVCRRAVAGRKTFLKVGDGVLAEPPRSGGKPVFALVDGITGLAASPAAAEPLEGRGIRFSLDFGGGARRSLPLESLLACWLGEDEEELPTEWYMALPVGLRRDPVGRGEALRAALLRQRALLAGGVPGRLTSVAALEHLRQGLATTPSDGRGAAVCAHVELLRRSLPVDVGVETADLGRGTWAAGVCSLGGDAYRALVIAAEEAAQEWLEVAALLRCPWPARFGEVLELYDWLIHAERDLLAALDAAITEPIR